MAEKKKTVIVLAGPTASGKTSLSIALAKAVGGEIISADSMQIYQKMDIGTAKVTKEEMQGIPHYMVDFVSPDQRYSVANFQKEAMKWIEKILEKGKVPIVVGGTGLYIESLLYENEFKEMNTDFDYREKLEQRCQEEGIEILYEEAKKIDPMAMEKISQRDKKRIMRVLEIYHHTGKTKSELDKESRQKETKYHYALFALTMPREVLYHRINQRVDGMMEQGLIQEVENIKQQYETFPTAMQGLGYKEVVDYLEGKTTKEEMIEKIKRETRRYAKRQLTWFRKYHEITWLDALDDSAENIKKIMDKVKE